MMTPNTRPTLILASASPRRRELLARLCGDFEVRASRVDERLDRPVTPEAVVAVALRKARAVAAQVSAGVVLGADTVVVLDGEPLGKPPGPDEARAMLRRLRGRAHEVITGVAVVDATTRREATAAVLSEVFMRNIPDEAIDAYAATDEPLDKAGAYAIQGRGGELVAGWVGSFSNIVGLPLEATRRLLADFGVAVSAGGSRA